MFFHFLVVYLATLASVLDYETTNIGIMSTILLGEYRFPSLVSFSPPASLNLILPKKAPHTPPQALIRRCPQQPGLVTRNIRIPHIRLTAAVCHSRQRNSD